MRKVLLGIAASFVALVGALAQYKAGDAVEVKWGSTWYAAKVVEAGEGKWKISYEGYGSNWDEWVGADRIRAKGAAVAQAKTPAATATASASSNSTPKSYPFPDRPADARAGIEGAFMRVMTSYFNGRLSMTNEGWFFTKNGRVSRSPTGGFSFDEFSRRKDAAKTDGVYWIEGDKLVLLWASGSKPETLEFARDGKSLRLGGLLASAVDGFPRGWRAEVTYEGGASSRGGGSFVSSSSTLALRRDGTFRNSSLGSASIDTAGVSAGASSSGAAAGTYEFDGYTLTLTHADGRVEKRTVFAFSDRDAQGAPEYLWRDGTMMHRESAKP